MSGAGAFRGAIARGEVSIGTWQTLVTGVGAELVGRAGFDWVLLDTQHGEIGWVDLQRMIQAVELGRSAAFVRVPWNDPAQIMRAADLGAAGVVVPMVSTVGDAELASAAMRFPPAGNRSFGPVRGTCAIGKLPADPVCLLMIETAEGLANVEAIARVAGIDGLFIGVVDLALSLGLGSHDDPRLLQAIDRIVAACNAAGVVAGAPGMSADHAGALLARGLRFVTVGGDVLSIMRGATADSRAAALLRESHRRGEGIGNGVNQ